MAATKRAARNRARKAKPDRNGSPPVDNKPLVATLLSPRQMTRKLLGNASYSMILRLEELGKLHCVRPAGEAGKVYHTMASVRALAEAE